MQLPFPRTGMDFTDGTLRLAATQKHGHTFRATYFAEAPIASERPLDDLLTQTDIFAQKVRESVQTLGRTPLSKYCSVALPDTHTFCFTIFLHERPASELDEAVRWEAGQHVPFGLDEMSLAWRILDRNDDMLRIQIVAAPTSVIEAVAHVAETAGFIVVEALPAAVATVAAIDLPAATAPRLLVSCGTYTTTLIIERSNGIPLTVTTAAFTQQRLLQELQRTLSLSEDEAWKALSVFGVANTTDTSVQQALLPELHKLVETIATAQDFLALHANGARAETVFVTGSATQTRGFAEMLEQAAQLPVTQAPLLVTLQKQTQSASAFPGPLGLSLPRS